MELLSETGRGGAPIAAATPIFVPLADPAGSRGGRYGYYFVATAAASRRARATAYRLIPAATEAFRDSTMDVIGMPAIASHDSRTSRLSPLPSEPSTTISGSVSKPVFKAMISIQVGKWEHLLRQGSAAAGKVVFLAEQASWKIDQPKHTVRCHSARSFEPCKVGFR